MARRSLFPQFPHPIFVVFHNVRSAQNVGALFRTADAAGAEKIFLTGYTPMPRDRFGRARSAVSKTALGAEEIVLWETYGTFEELHARLREENVRCVAVEQTTQARSYTDFRLKQTTAFVFGNEVEGLGENVRAYCDEAIEIPMAGAKESLNVSVAVGIILFSIRDCTET